MNLISPDTYAKAVTYIRSYNSLAKVLFEICTYMHLKLYKQKSNFDNEIYNHKKKIIKSMCTLSARPDIEPLSC